MTLSKHSGCGNTAASSTASNSLLALLQISDSAFPIGAYSHSFGMETWIQESQFRTAEDVQTAVSELLTNSIAPLQGVACSLAHRCYISSDFKRFVKLNGILSAFIWAEESRRGSSALGRRLLRQAERLGWLQNLPSSIFAEIPELHHACIFGYLCATLRVELEQAVAAYLYGSASSMISACVKLVPLGHTEGQVILSGLQARVYALANECISKSEDEMQSFAPMHERACVQHENLYSRLFQS